MRSNIPDFTDSEIRIIQETVKQRYSQEIELMFADSELRLHSSDRELTLCPTVVFKEQKATFVIFKISLRNFRCQFYYRGYEQFGTGRNMFTDVGDCVITLLQVHEDYEREQKNHKDSNDE